jgi:diphosphomevalonate decarboxylase
LSERGSRICLNGSACRSIPGGYVEWQAGEGDEDSYAYSVAPPEHWDLTDCIAMVSQAHKGIGSTEGHAVAGTSPLQEARVRDTPRRLELCCRAIQERDFGLLAEVIEQDCNMMHGVMMTSTPQLLYWQPATIRVMLAVQDWRKGGLPVCYTVDAGPNVHVMCPTPAAGEVVERLLRLRGVERVLTARPGGAAYLEA